MIRKYTLFLTAALLVLVLTGCGRTVEERSDEAIQSARDAFEMNRKQPTESLDGIEFYKPVGWKVTSMKEERTLVLTKRSQTLTAQYDLNAKPDSHAYYDLLKAVASKQFIQQQTFTDAGMFGFVAVSEHGDTSVEVVTGAGPVQVTAIVQKEDLVPTVEEMMEIARSLQLES